MRRAGAGAGTAAALFGGAESGLALADALGEPAETYASNIEGGARWGGEIELLVLARLYCAHIHAIDIETGALLSYAPAAAPVPTGAAERERAPSRHIVLLYSGLHYDAFVLRGAPGTAAAYVATGASAAPSVFRLDTGNAPGTDVSLFPGDADAADMDADAGADSGAASVSAGAAPAAVASDVSVRYGVLDKARAVAAALRTAGGFTNTSKFTLRCASCGVTLRGQKEALLHCAATQHNNFEEYTPQQQ